MAGISKRQSATAAAAAELHASVGLSGFTTAANTPYLGGSSSAGGGGGLGPGSTEVGESQKRGSSSYRSLSDVAPMLPPNLYDSGPNSTATLSFMLPSLLSILWFHESAIVVQCFLFGVLILYGLDLVNARDGLTVGVWIVALLLTMASGFGTLLQVDDTDATGGAMLGYMMQLAVEGMLYCAWACWVTLQCQWLYKNLPSYAVRVEQALHSLVPPVAASVLSFNLLRFLMNYWGTGRVATVAPLLFASVMAVGMITVGCCPRSFALEGTTNDGDATEKKKQPPRSSAPTFAVSSFNAKVHSMILVLVPALMHLLIFRRRIFSRSASVDELFDLVLVWTVPYLQHCAIVMLPERGPYALPNVLFPQTGRSTLRGTVAPLIATLAASVAAQQLYLIPLCNAVAYQFNGHNLASTFVISLYLTGATLASLFAIWIWGRKSTETHEPLFGEYHEDVVQLSISAGGMLLGKAFGFPWNLTPLPILAFLGLSVWLTTRMMRYLSIFLFVIHAAGVVLFSYRFASISVVIPLPLPWTVNVGLTRFGMIEVIGSVLIGLVVGFVARPSGGFGADFLNRVDVPGFVLVAYTALLSVLELTLLRRRKPADLIGVEGDTDVEDSQYLYDHATALMTTILVVAISALCKRYNVISRFANATTISLAVGEAIAVIIDASESDNKIRSDQNEEFQARRLVYRATTASLLVLVILSPRALLSPIHVKRASTTRYKRSLADGKPQIQIPSGAYRKPIAYCLLILPAALLASARLVLSPLVMALSTHYNGGAYYSMAPPLSEMIGFALSLWGVACLFMLSHYLPDGGAENWKKASALTLLMGIGIAFSAPTVPEWLVGDTDFGISNPYAAISSLGSEMANQGRTRSGGWGLLFASLATLLAITGPFELRERRPPSGKKDKTLFLRLMMFSIMFGSGLSWFVTIQNMSQEHFLPLAVTSLACIVISFFGTVACVLGYYVELEGFDEVDQMSKVWAGAFVLFGIVVVAPSVVLSTSVAKVFGPGGSLSTYLTIAAIVTLSMSVVLRIRQAKNQATRALGNLSCICSYVCSVVIIYGRLGVAGLDGNFGVTTVLGAPGSLFGCFCVAPVLLLLDGEASAEKRNRVSRMGGTTGKPVKGMGITFKNLRQSNRIVPPMAATVLTLYLAGLYSIFLRGSIYIGSNVPKTHKEAVSNIMGRGKDALASMAERATSYSQALVLSARLAGSGFWTSSNPISPLIHLAGLAATVPSIFLVLMQMWTGVKSSRSQVVFALPFNVFPIFFCKGTPSVQAVAIMALVGGLLQLFGLQRSERRSQMRI